MVIIYIRFHKTNKTMKKKYIVPEMEEFKMESVNPIAASDPGYGGGGGGAGSAPIRPDVEGLQDLDDLSVLFN